MSIHEENINAEVHEMLKHCIESDEVMANKVARYPSMPGKTT